MYSILHLPNVLREREEEELDAYEEFLKEEAARKHAKHIGQLLVDGQIVPIIGVEYKIKNKQIKDGKYNGYYFERDGYEAIVDVLFPANLGRKYILDYIVLHIKNDKKLRQFKDMLNMDNIIEVKYDGYDWILKEGKRKREKKEKSDKKKTRIAGKQ